MYDIGIVGAGPAGLTAALYALRMGRKVIVFEKETCGGQILPSPEIENFPAIPHISGVEFTEQLLKQVKDLGVELKMEEVVQIEDGTIKKIHTKNNCYSVSSIILAPGLKRRKLGLPKEEDFLGKGVSYCATCDGFFFKNKEVAVVGGGNTALEDALFLSNYCKKVFLIHRSENFRGEQVVLDQLKQKENVEILTSTIVTELHGQDQLEAITIQSKETKQIKIDGLFIAIGQIPQNGPFGSLISTDSFGYFVENEDGKTEKKGIFVAGDAKAKKVRQLVTAASDGACSAFLANEYLEENID